MRGIDDLQEGNSTHPIEGIGCPLEKKKKKTGFKKTISDLFDHIYLSEFCVNLLLLRNSKSTTSKP